MTSLTLHLCVTSRLTTALMYVGYVPESLNISKARTMIVVRRLGDGKCEIGKVLVRTGECWVHGLRGLFLDFENITVDVRSYHTYQLGKVPSENQLEPFSIIYMKLRTVTHTNRNRNVIAALRDKLTNRGAWFTCSPPAYGSPYPGLPGYQVDIYMFCDQ